MDKLNLRTLIETGTFLTLTSRWRTVIPGKWGQYISLTSWRTAGPKLVAHKLKRASCDFHTISAEHSQIKNNLYKVDKHEQTRAIFGSDLG